MKKLIWILALCAIGLCPTILQGQYAESALQLSNLNYNGTARFTGMGGAFGAIGGDFSTLSINPAGIGVYNANEVVITPSLYNTRSFSDYFNSKNEEFNTRLNMNNIGLVLAIPDHSNNNFKAFQFGFGYNRLANFNNNIFFKGFNDRNSYARALSDDANYFGVDMDSPESAFDLAAITNIIYPDGNEWVTDKNRNVYQQAFIETEGGIDEMVFSFGGNYDDKLYFGMTLGIPFMTYYNYYDYYEWDDKGSTPFKDMHYTESYESNGVGVNGKFGLIYKPVHFFRIGAAIHTPTYYWNIEEHWTADMLSHFYDSTQWNGYETLPDFSNIYKQTTPMRVTASMAFVLGKYALISGDYEWVNHSKNKLNPSRDFSSDNDYIKSYYKNQHIVRAGAELKCEKFYLRGGYGWYSSPYKDQAVNDASVNTWSLGTGIRLNSYGIDFAYQHAKSKSKYYPYDADADGRWNDYSPSANLDNNANSYMLTFSYRF